jgi:hypothetical protein
MNYFIPLLFLCLVFSCGQKQQVEKPTDFSDKVIEFVIENKSDQAIEIDGLYDSTIDDIPEDKDEKLLLAEKLKTKGFKVKTSGRGNYPPIGERIVTLTLQKGDCECEVSKIYYHTIFESTYIRKERIHCKNIQ